MKTLINKLIDDFPRDVSLHQLDFKKLSYVNFGNSHQFLKLNRFWKTRFILHCTYKHKQERKTYYDFFSMHSFN